MSGLKEEIKSMVKLIKPSTLQETMKAARLQEKIVNAIKSLHKTLSTFMSSQKSTTKISTYSKPEQVHQKQPEPHSSNTTSKIPSSLKSKHKNITKPFTKLPNNFRKISPTEFAEKKAKGLAINVMCPILLAIFVEKLI
ncbi:hypothetical protein ACH5RR_009381 [Cinchona calisaya]|uniref:Uncharacterized protein n=1 Tax=Cinchona calisaya TaxID=153742 RepID=A0ABD3AFW0_9GENT